MNLDLWERFVQSLRLVFPVSTVLVFICLSNAFLPVPALAPFMPAFVYPALWFWMLWRPDMMHFAIIFVLALIPDLLSDGLIGFTPLFMLVLYRIIGTNDRFFRNASPVLLWLIFSAFVFTSLGIQWLLKSLLFWTALNPAAFIQQAITTALALPPVAFILKVFDRLVLGRRELRR